MTRRVVITGMGAITPVGNTVEDFWNSIKNGRHGIGLITKFDTTDFKVKLAAEVKNFDPEKYMTKREIKRYDPFTQYAIAATYEAVQMANAAELVKDNDRAGVILGTGIGGLQGMEDQIIRMHERGPNRVNPLFIPYVITNMAAGNVSIKFGVKGICSSIVTACATAGNSIGEAFRNIKHGYSDIIIAGGAESSITKIGIAGFTVLTALSESTNPDRASIPFDKDRDGFVMGEGGGVLIVEELEHAKERGATIHAEIVGYGATGDAYHMTSPNPTGEGAAKAMLLAIQEAGLEKEEIGYINAHGTSTPSNDLPETIAIKTVFGDWAYKLNVSSTKSMVGHLLGGAGAVEAIACVQALKQGFIPPTAGLETAEEGCDLNYTPKVGVERDLKYAISNSFGFGGHNAVLCFKKWEG